MESCKGNSEQDNHEWKVTEISTELRYPWEIRASGETLIITEVGGTIVMIDSDKKLTRYPVETSSPVTNDGGSGLLGIVLSDDFAQSGTAYIYYTYTSGGSLTNRISEINFNGTSWKETRILLDGIPGHQLYNGGRIGIGPDGYLYATTGWLRNPRLPQAIKSLAGKVLRMDLQGRPAPGNPFENSYVYSYGHRNPQGLAWSPDGELYISEHGEAGNDEINLIGAGQNYGWPTVEGDNNRAGMTAPYVHSGNGTWAPAGIAFFSGNLLVANLGSRNIISVNLQNKNIQNFFSSGDRMRAILPYGNGMYLITTNTSPRSTTPAPATDKLLWLQQGK